MDADTGHLCRGRIWLVMKQLGHFNTRLMLSKEKKALPAIFASIGVLIATEGLAIIRVKLDRAIEKKTWTKRMVEREWERRIMKRRGKITTKTNHLESGVIKSAADRRDAHVVSCI